ncbi:MAG: porin, partial [Proteobacteria bacterium]|nr:porin [Pseudomonadota bacterium]
TAGAELAVQRGALLVESESFRLGVERRVGALADPRFDGWYLQGSWVLTGEPRKYNAANGAFDAPSPKRAFDPRAGGWGAFELAARYSDLDLNFAEGVLGTAPSQDAVRGGEQRIWALGLNWYLNPAIRFMFQGQHVEISRLSPGAAAFNTPVGAEIGQEYDTVAMRAQFGF